MPLAVGTRLGSYEVLGALGANGMGEVYRARDGLGNGRLERLREVIEVRQILVKSRR